MNNDIVEISNDSKEEVEVSFEKVEEKPTKKKRSLKEKWHGIPKKKRVLIIVISILVILLIAGFLVYYFFFRDKKEPVVDDEVVVIEKDNYRYENGVLILLDKNDKEVGRYTCEVKDDKKCMVAKADYKEDTFDRVLSVDESGIEIEKSSGLYGDYIFITDNEKTFLYNYKKEKKELEVGLFKPYINEKQLVVVKDDTDKYGLIEFKEDSYDYLIRPLYDYLGVVNNEIVYLIAKDKEETYIVDSGGKKLSKNISADIMSVNKDYIVTKKSKTYSLYNYENEELESNYDFIGLHNSVISFVKGNRLYLKDSGLNKLYEEGIRLENSDYVTKYVFDSDKTLKETKKAYEVSPKGNELLLTIGEDSRSINLLEGKVSGKYAVMSYFDGKLYFYSDKDKDEVIGTYTCNNKNVLTSDKLLDACTIYSSNGEFTGIYNNDYVILIDTMNQDNIVYYIYSLKEKKIKGNYSSIEVLNPDELSEEVKHIDTTSSYIKAVASNGNNKGNMGILEITGEKISGKVSFKYKKMEKNKDYYLFTNTDGTFTIFDKSFNEISMKFDYVVLYDKYYVGIINKKLNVYNYITKEGILENDLNVVSNDFKIDFTDGIKITIGSDTYEYDSNGKEKQVEIPLEENNNTTDNTENNNTENNGENNEEG